MVEPTFLILDEPTNHLDLEACVWLEETLKKWKRILLMVSHSQDFLNGVCTNIINMHQKKLKYYSGGCMGARQGGGVGGKGALHACTRRRSSAARVSGACLEMHARTLARMHAPP